MKRRSHLIDRTEPIYSWHGDQTANCGEIVKETVSIMSFEGDLTSLGTFLEQYRKSMYGCRKCAEIPVTHKYLFEVVAQAEIRAGLNQE